MYVQSTQANVWERTSRMAPATGPVVRKTEGFLDGGRPAFSTVEVMVTWPQGHRGLPEFFMGSHDLEPFTRSFLSCCHFKAKFPENNST